MRRLAILGSTGSIGQSALSLAGLYPDRIEIVALGARRNSEALYSQVKQFHPQLVALHDPVAAEELRRQAPSIRVVSGVEGLTEVACHPEADTLVSAVTGAAGLKPTYHAVEEGKTIALANKEAMVMAGDLLVPLAKACGGTILPVDSEHSALHQCLRGSHRSEVKRLILTASGGPFVDHSPSELETVTVDEALNHPTWSMGPKITIDSATMMNKGLEVIEAHHFFGISGNRIAVVVHPQSVVHSMVEFVDGTMLAQMSITDMRSCLLYALGLPDRWESRLPALDLFSLPSLQFRAPDQDRFPCLRLAYEALRLGDTFPTVLNAANEVAVALFLDHQLPFHGIPILIEQALAEHSPISVSGLDDLLEMDRNTRASVARMVARTGSGDTEK
jgi:1-deoxy-D-xylulose-5-phosphate reductoisomerase